MLSEVNRAMIERCAGPLAMIEMKAGQAHLEWAIIQRLMNAVRREERERAIAVLSSLVAMKQEFDRSDNDHASAYYAFVKGCCDAWDAASSYITQAQGADQ